MARYTATPDLFAALEERCERTRKARSTILFRRGEQAIGMFLVIRGTVGLDFGVDSALGLANTYAPGALVGLPATLTKRTYSMTATVTQDAELGFLSTEALTSLLREQPGFCRELLEILGAKLSHTEQVTKALLRKEKLPKLESGVA